MFNILWRDKFAKELAQMKRRDLRVATMRTSNGLWSGASEPNQKVGPLGLPFGPTAISKGKY